MLCISPTSNLRHFTWKKYYQRGPPASVNSLFCIYSLYLNGLAQLLLWVHIFCLHDLGMLLGMGNHVLFPLSPCGSFLSIERVSSAVYSPGASRFLKTHPHPSPGFSYCYKLKGHVVWAGVGGHREALCWFIQWMQQILVSCCLLSSMLSSAQGNCEDIGNILILLLFQGGCMGSGETK